MIIYTPYKIERFTCLYKECGAKCCTPGRVITHREKEKISEAIGLKPEEFIERETERGLFRLKGKNDMCIFLKEDFSCSLHNIDAKPLSCQMYPFLFEGIIYSDEIVLKVRAADECPGIGIGEEVDEDFELKIEALGNKFVSEIKAGLKEEEK